MITKAEKSRMIKAEALRLGFLDCGIAEARFLEEEAPKLETWLRRGYHGEMKWMEGHFDKRLDPRKLVPGARSVISVLLNYYPEKQQPDDAPQIAKYAYGEDYHWLVKRRLKDLLAYIRREIGAVEGRAFVDSAPVLDRVWAREAGLGWQGKHTLLLSKGTGSFYVIGELIVDLALEPDAPIRTDHCGSCTRCIDACPTDAIIEPNLLDANKCISYLTIELKEALPTEHQEQMEGWAFGCDICQDVCPWNRFAQPHEEPDLAPHPLLTEMEWPEWEQLTEEAYRKVFKKSAVKRAKYQGLKRNIHFVRSGEASEEEEGGGT